MERSSLNVQTDVGRQTFVLPYISYSILVSEFKWKCWIFAQNSDIQLGLAVSTGCFYYTPIERVTEIELNTNLIKLVYLIIADCRAAL